MELWAILEWRFPDMNGVGYELRANDLGVSVIGWWDQDIMGYPKPTQADLDVWALPAARAFKRRELRKAMNADYKLLFTLDDEFIDAMRDGLFRREAKATTQAPLSAADQSTVDKITALNQKLAVKLTRVNAVDATVASVTSEIW